MALTMTSSFANEGATRVVGRKRVWTGLVTFDNSYPTGGEAITPAQFGLSVINHVNVRAKGGTEVVVWDHVNSKLQIFTADGVEALNASDQSAIVCHCEVTGY